MSERLAPEVALFGEMTASYGEVMGYLYYPNKALMWLESTLLINNSNECQGGTYKGGKNAWFLEWLEKNFSKDPRWSLVRMVSNL